MLTFDSEGTIINGRANMLYSKFVIIAASEMDNRIKVLFGIEELMLKRINVEFWNISPITYNIHIESKDIEGVTCLVFNNKKSFFEKVKEYRKEAIIYLVYMNYTPATYFCFRTLSKYNCCITYCLNGILPMPNRSIIDKIRLKKNNLYRIPIVLFYRMLLKTPLLKPIQYQLNTCLLTPNDYKASYRTKQISFKTTDVVLAQSYGDRLLEKPYMVFIDQYMPFHTDVKATGIKNVCSEPYYRQLNLLFSKIEKETGLEVVIAAHPIAKRYKNEDFFNGRRVFFNQTQTLVRHCQGVAIHTSTAISFVVLYGKPSIVLVSDEMSVVRPMQFENALFRAGLLGVDVVNIDHIPEKKISLKYNEFKYNEYKENYLLIPNAGEESNADVIISMMEGRYEG